MAQVSFSTQVAAPVETVFAVCTDLEKSPERIKGIAKMEILTPGPFGVGTRFRETRVFGGREATETMEVTEVVPNRSYSVGANSCGMQYLSTFRFEPRGNGTEVTMEFSGKPVTLMAKLMTPLGWLMSGMIKKCIQKDLTDLKAYIEAMPK